MMRQVTSIEVIQQLSRNENYVLDIRKDFFHTKEGNISREKALCLFRKLRLHLTQSLIVSEPNDQANKRIYNFLITMKWKNIRIIIHGLGLKYFFKSSYALKMTILTSIKRINLSILPSFFTLRFLLNCSTAKEI